MADLLGSFLVCVELIEEILVDGLRLGGVQHVKGDSDGEPVNQFLKVIQEVCSRFVWLVPMYFIGISMNCVVDSGPGAGAGAYCYLCKVFDPNTCKWSHNSQPDFSNGSGI